MKVLLTLLCFMAAPVLAQDLAPQGGTLTRFDLSEAGSVRLPDAPWSQGVIVAETEGNIRRAAYRLPDASRTTLQILVPLRSQLEDQGFVQVFSCADAACGGFDFRFQLDLLPEPDMHVDLGDFRYVLMRRDTGEPHSVAIVTSRTSSAGFVHITEVGTAILEAPAVENAIAEALGQPIPNATSDLADTGREVLGDLVFAVGSASLGDGPFQSLDRLAEWLDENPSARVVLVGHTDAVGSLAANVGLSERRAAAVAARLVELGVNRGQLQSAGAGYLAPLKSNLTEEGRAANRRVEVVLLSLK